MYISALRLLAMHKESFRCHCEGNRTTDEFVLRT